jgi:hypothetical protein
MKRKKYERPTMKVVKLQHRSQILTGSKGQAGVQDYNWHSETEESRSTPMWNIDDDEE